MRQLSWFVAVVCLTCCWFGRSSGTQTDKTIRYEIREEVPIGTKIGNLVTDSDMRKQYRKEVLQQLEFRFLSDPRVPLAIDASDGVLRTKGRIDRDSLPNCRQMDRCETSLDVTVQPVAYFRIIKVSLEIIDINDNPPRFGDSHHAFISILESASIGSTFLLPSATDPDSPVYGVQHYDLNSLWQNFELKITPKLDGFLDVRLLLKEKLDREMREEYVLKLIAYDGGQPPRSDSINVTVRVLDSNDNDPIFEKDSYEVKIVENLPLRTIILKVTATDQDSGVNGQVVYGMSPQTRQAYGDMFGVNNQTGDIFIVGTIDREKADVYQLVVTAEDCGVDSHPVDMTVTVVVTDQNDNPPKVIVNTLTAIGTDFANVPENSQIGTFVAHVTVSDPDAGRNGSVNCSLDSRQFNFIQRPLLPQSDIEYQILTAVRLDREVKDVYNVTIVCSDDGLPRKQTQKYIQVVVIDENDNKPIFSRDVYTASLTENNDIGSAVLQLNATDADQGDNAYVRYRISSQAASNWFTVDQIGMIYAKQSFDREAIGGPLRFQVLAIDSGSPLLTGTALVVVNIEDLNDERPVFVHSSLSFFVSENELIGTSVGTVSARERDLPPYNICSYKFLREGNTVAAETDSFSIDFRNGTITTRKVLDRETQPVYYLTAAVFEPGVHGYSSTASVVVFVNDVNDNDPKFEFPTNGNNTVYISNRVPVGHVVATLSAFDADDEKNAEISYRLQEEDEDQSEAYFRVEPILGEISVARDLSRIEYEVFRLTAVAVDRGLLERSTSGVLNLIVNRTIYFEPSVYVRPGSGTVGGHFDEAHAVIVIIACFMCVFLIAIVVLALLVARRQRRRRRDGLEPGKYNCRTEALKMLAPPTSASRDYIAIAGGSNVEATPLKRPSDVKITSKVAEVMEEMVYCSNPRQQTYHWSVWPQKDQQLGAADRDSIRSIEGSTYTDSGHGPSEEGDPNNSGNAASGTTKRVQFNPSALYIGCSSTLSRPNSGTGTRSISTFTTPPPPSSSASFQQFKHVPGSNCSYAACTTLLPASNSRARSADTLPHALPSCIQRKALAQAQNGYPQASTIAGRLHRSGSQGLRSDAGRDNARLGEPSTSSMYPNSVVGEHTGAYRVGDSTVIV